MENIAILLQKLCQRRIRNLILVLGISTFAVLGFHKFALASTNVSSFHTSKIAALWKRQVPSDNSSIISSRIGEFSQVNDSENSTSAMLHEVVDSEASENGTKDSHIDKIKVRGGSEENDNDDDSDLDEYRGTEKEFKFNHGNGFVLKKVNDSNDDFITQVKVKELKDNSVHKVEETVEGHGVSPVLSDGYAIAPADVKHIDNGIKNSNNGVLFPPHAPSSSISIYVNEHIKAKDMNISDHAVGIAFNKSSPNKPAVKYLPNNKGGSLQSNLTTSSINNPSAGSHLMMILKKRRRRRQSISEMNRILMSTRASYQTMRPRWSSVLDRQIFNIRSQIDHSPVVKNDRQLYGPAFKNVSMFKRSFELMEQTLKVYIYKDGERPIFHQPLLRGIYASEGWFMKLMEENKRFVVKDPRKAHLFYMPFGARHLKTTLYVHGTHNRSYLREYLNKYVDMIAAKYPFWNRTRGADHFLVACHDWGPYETRASMYHAIRALCNADLSSDFRLGIDISLPETYVRNSSDTLRGLGGKPAKQRSILAFYAGSVHGALRSVLLEFWENKDPDVKILGPMPPGARRTDYIQNMKSSRYCICPRGYEVHSARVVEAIFYECVPVIISDNYVPPLFEVLNWEAFSVSIREADIPRLKEILVSIPEKKYLSLQMGVRKVQKHFLWHSKPVRFDLFHMILHSVWYNRVYTIRPM